VGRVRARSLYEAGYENTDEVRKARPEELLELPGIGSTIAERLTDKELSQGRSEENKKEEREEAGSNQASLADF